MDLEREKLERADRKLFGRLGQDETYQMVRVPVTPAIWSTWKRYCEVTGVSMGRTIVGLIERELEVAEADPADQQHVSTRDLQEQLAVRETELDAREREFDAEYDRIGTEAERLGTRIAELRSLERNQEVRSRNAVQPAPAVPKVGRDERCPCGSGRKYKQCHGR